MQNNPKINKKSMKMSIYFKMLIMTIIIIEFSHFNSQWTPKALINHFNDSKFVNTYPKMKFAPNIEYCDKFEGYLKWMGEDKNLFVYIIDEMPNSYEQNFFFWKEKNAEQFLRGILKILNSRYGVSINNSLLILIAIKDKRLFYIKGKEVNLFINLKNPDYLYKKVFQYFDKEEDYEKGICYFFDMVYTEAHQSSFIIILFLILWLGSVIGLITFILYKKRRYNNSPNNYLVMNLRN